MPIRICPNCNERYIVDNNTGDYIHECNSGNNTLDQEDVVVIGKWEDYTGSNFNIKPSEVMLQGAANKLFGTRADIEGEDVETRTRRGQRSSTRRQRQHLQYIKQKGGD